MNLNNQMFITSRYLIFNGIFAVCIYYGFIEGIEGVKNFALGLAWLLSIVGTLVLLGFASYKEEMTERCAKEVMKYPQGAPMWFDMTFDIIVALTFIWFGHFVLAFFYILHIFGAIKIYQSPEMNTYHSLKNGVKNDD